MRARITRRPAPRVPSEPCPLCGHPCLMDSEGYYYCSDCNIEFVLEEEAV